MIQDNIESMPVEDLSFDLQNPRLTEFDISVRATDSEVIQVLWDTMDVRELVLSIAASGYFRHEPLIVAEEGGAKIVIEGNRRLAAVRLLLEPNLLETGQQHIPAIGDEARDSLRLLPVITGTREETWRYIGFKHVNGPARWSSYAKSHYIAKVHNQYGIPLEDIAQQIGDTHRTVERLYRGIAVLEQAETMNVFDRTDTSTGRFAFSHLYTGLEYDGIGSFVGISSNVNENKDLIPEEKKEDLRQLFLWLYGSRQQQIRPVIRSQNPDLRNLNTVLESREATAALRASNDLTVAYEITRPPSNVFEESLFESKRNLEKAHSLLSTGYDGSEQLLSIANDIFILAEDLVEDMHQKRTPRRGRRSRPRP